VHRLGDVGGVDGVVVRIRAVITFFYETCGRKTVKYGRIESVETTGALNIADLTRSRPRTSAST